MSMLAEFLSDSPEAILAVHALKRLYCKATVVGELPEVKAALIQFINMPHEPRIFGTNLDAIWVLLQSIKGWDCVNVPAEIASTIGSFVQKQLKRPVRYYSDFYYALSVPVRRFEHELVRRLTIEDVELLEAAPKEFRGHGYGTAIGLLEDGLVACGIALDEIVSIAHTGGHTEKYADIGVITREDWRNKGLASAAASIVAEGLQERGITPVWSTGDDNLPSVRTAQKLGFTKVSQREYVIVEENKSSFVDSGEV
ncbi:MAG: GNAT family N-acetyltransferase [Promethearchaeota archaeon]